MKAKSLRILGVTFLVIGIFGIVSGIAVYMFHYAIMERGYYQYSELLLGCFAILLCFGMLIYPAIPILIVSEVRKNREISEVTAQIESSKFCSQCGAKCINIANFCPKCGHRFR